MLLTRYGVRQILTLTLAEQTNKVMRTIEQRLFLD